MKYILPIFLLITGLCYSQDSLIYKAAIFDIDDSSLVAYIFAPEYYVISKDQLTLHFDPKAEDSLVEVKFDHPFEPALKLYKEHGTTGKSIYLSALYQKNFILKSGFQYYLFRQYQSPKYYYENKEFGVILMSIEKY